MLQSYQGFSSPVYAESLRGQELTQTDFLEAMQKKKKKSKPTTPSSLRLFIGKITFFVATVFVCLFCFCFNFILNQGITSTE